MKPGQTNRWNQSPRFICRLAWRHEKKEIEAYPQLLRRTDTDTASRLAQVRNRMAIDLPATAELENFPASKFGRARRTPWENSPYISC